MMPDLTSNQQYVLDGLFWICRERVALHRKTHGYLSLLETVKAGDKQCAALMGAMTSEAGYRLTMPTDAVRRTLQALAGKGLVTRNDPAPGRWACWWPAGLAGQIYDEIRPDAE